MYDLIVNPQLKSLIPALSDNEFKQLEQNILNDGRVREPIIVWNNTIIDGHNRWAIIQKHPEISYTVLEMEFADIYAAQVWMCKNQLGRRNLSKEQQSYLRGKQYHAEKMTKGTHNQYVQAGSEKPQNEVSHSHNTAARLAVEHGVSKATIERDAEFAKGIDEIKEVSEDAAGRILCGKAGTNKAVIQNISKMDEVQKNEVIEKIVAGADDIIPPKKKNSRKERYDLINNAQDVDYSSADTIISGQKIVSDVELDSTNFTTGLQNHINPYIQMIDDNFIDELISILQNHIIAPVTGLVETLEKAKSAL